MILAPLILGLLCIGWIAYERNVAIRREAHRRDHYLLMREIRRHRDADQ